MALTGGRLSFALSTRELWPFVTGGGIGRVVHATLRLLAADADVTVITREGFREEYERMRDAGDPRLPHPGVRFEFLPEPKGFALGPFASFHHCWSAWVYERLCSLYPHGGPDLVEFGDYLGEGFVTIQARRSGHPSMRRTRVGVRLHTSLEMVDALNGTVDLSEEHRAIYTLERGSIAWADEILSPGGDVLDTYRRFYGEGSVAPGTTVPHALAGVDGASATKASPPGTRMRLLYLGRLERRKGVQELVEAASRLPPSDWALTLVGGDTNTGPSGGSMRAHLERVAAGHERIVFHEPVPHEQVLDLVDNHHVVVIPSLWECWSNVAREALLRNRPVLATPTGALADAVKQGMSGWLASGTSSEELERALLRVLDSRDEIESMIASGGPRRRLDELVDPDATVAGYRGLAAGEGEKTLPPREKIETVSAVVVCSAGSRPVDRTLRALREQLRPVDQLVVVCRGVQSLAPGFDSSAVDTLELVPHDTPDADLRNAGCAAATGDLVLMVEAGTDVAPDLLQTLISALQRNPQAAFATAWADGLDPAGAPLGNFANLVPEYDNAAVAPLFRREVFKRGHRFDPALAGCAGRAFYAALAADGLFGCVVPVRLVSRAPYSAPCRDEPLMSRLVEHELARPEPMSWVKGLGDYSSSRE